jgi:hypothetical protein
MLFKAEITNKEDLLKWYQARENSCYIICSGTRIDGKQIRDKYLGSDGIIGLEKLNSSVDFLSQTTNPYIICSFNYFEGVETVKIKDIEGEMIIFQFNIASYSNSVGAVAIPSIAENNSNDYGKVLLQMMQKQNEAMFAKMQEFEYKLQERLQIEEEDDEDDEDEEPAPLTGKERLMGALAGIIEKPEFTETMFGLVGMAFNKFLAPKENTQNGSGQYNSSSDGTDEGRD